MYYNFTVKDKEYKLKLSTDSIMQLEKVIGCNPMMIFGERGDKVPTVTTMVNILHQSLQPLNHGISLKGASEIFDEWIDEGHKVKDFIAIIVDIYRASGLADEDNSKN